MLATLVEREGISRTNALSGPACDDDTIGISIDEVGAPRLVGALIDDVLDELIDSPRDGLIAEGGVIASLTAKTQSTLTRRLSLPLTFLRIDDLPRRDVDDTDAHTRLYRLTLLRGEETILASRLAAELGDRAEDKVVSTDTLTLPSLELSLQFLRVATLEEDELPRSIELRHEDIEGLLCHGIIVALVEDALAVLRLVGEAPDGDLPLEATCIGRASVIDPRMGDDSLGLLCSSIAKPREACQRYERKRLKYIHKALYIYK